ncbi:arginine deiminase-related protein [Labrys sp. KNU-23]|uniref:arginine deiminase-related protein n=1 Tax=Labrys sp. KNU-23 TaxID=2789216 RepID=UPI00165BB5F6
MSGRWPSLPATAAAALSTVPKGLATNFVPIGLDRIVDAPRKREIVVRLERSGHDVLALSSRQIENFAGNAIELQGKDGRLFTLSTTALAALPPAQARPHRAKRHLLHPRHPHHRGRGGIGAVYAGGGEEREGAHSALVALDQIGEHLASPLFEPHS